MISRSHNYKTNRAVVVAWLQMVVGRIWHTPGRLWNIYRFHTEPKVDPDVFKARIDASIARLKAEERTRIAARQAKADADSAALKKES